MPSSSTPIQGWPRAAARLAAVVALLATSGCFKATFINPTVVPGETHEEWTDFFLGGVVGTEDFDVRDFCPGEAAMVATGGDFLTGLVSVATLGIYVPRKVYVTCALLPAPQAMPAATTPPPAATAPQAIPSAAVPSAQPTPATPEAAPGSFTLPPAPPSAGGAP